MNFKGSHTWVKVQSRVGHVTLTKRCVKDRRRRADKNHIYPPICKTCSMCICHCKVIATTPDCRKSKVICECLDKHLDLARYMMLSHIECPKLKQVVMKERKKIVEYVHRDLIHGSLYQEIILGNFLEKKEEGDDALTSDGEDQIYEVSDSSEPEDK